MGGQVNMQKHRTEQPVMEGNLASEDDADGEFCPECGQSLDLTRHEKAAVRHRRLEPLVFLVFGMCLTIAFGLRTGNTVDQLSSLDQQIVALRARAAQGTLPKPGNPAMIVEDTMAEVRTEQIDVQLTFQRDVTGLGLGLFTLVVGAVSRLRQRPRPADARQRPNKPHGPSSSDHPPVAGGAWELGGIVATTLVRMLLLLFVTTIGLLMIQGTPPSVQLLDQTLTRITEIVATIARSLS